MFNAKLLLVVSPLLLASCKGLTPAEATAFSALDGPLCDIAGFGVSLLVSNSGSTVAVLCKDELDKLISENKLPAAAPGIAAAAAGTVANTTLKVTVGCVMEPVPGDPRHQLACPELHSQIIRHNVLKFKGSAK